MTETPFTSGPPVLPGPGAIHFATSLSPHRSLSPAGFKWVVTNLLDRIGQKYFGVIVPASINDSLGRRYALTVGKKF